MASQSTVSAEDALSRLDFGRVDAESEADLDRRFVRTGDFDQLVLRDIWVVLGAKGTGKSALFDLFVRFPTQARALAPADLRDVVVTSGTGFSDLSEIATGDLERLRRAESYDHEKLWRLYIAVRAELELTDLDWPLPNGPLKDLLRAVGSRADLRVGALLSQLWVMAIGNPPSQVSITARGATLTLRGGRRQLDVTTLLEDIDTTLEREGKVMWVLFDKVDELFPGNRDERCRALSSLMAASMALRRTFPRIQPRIMLRTDLWRGLEFTNKSHFADKIVELSWSPEQLKLLLIKRACADSTVRGYLGQLVLSLNRNNVEALNESERDAIMKAIFPSTVYPGAREAAILDWITARVADGMGTILPREAILMSNFAADFQWTLGGPDESSLISREAVRDAFRRVSENRRSTYLSEFPDLQPHFERFEGQITPTFTRTELESLMAGLSPSGIDMLRELYEIGVIKPIGAGVATATSFEVPRLYRQGLGMVIRGRP